MLDSSQLNEYEKIRLQNIREREALFANLKISEAKEDLVPTAARKVNRRNKSSARKQNISSTPVRRSNRLSDKKSSSVSG